MLVKVRAHLSNCSISIHAQHKELGGEWGVGVRKGVYTPTIPNPSKNTHITERETETETERQRETETDRQTFIYTRTAFCLYNPELSIDIESTLPSSDELEHALHAEVHGPVHPAVLTDQHL